jgi:hypothetical protein
LVGMNLKTCKFEKTYPDNLGNNEWVQQIISNCKLGKKTIPNQTF